MPTVIKEITLLEWLTWINPSYIWNRIHASSSMNPRHLWKKWKQLIQLLCLLSTSSGCTHQICYSTDVDLVISRYIVELYLITCNKQECAIKHSNPLKISCHSTVYNTLKMNSNWMLWQHAISKAPWSSEAWHKLKSTTFLDFGYLHQKHYVESSLQCDTAIKTKNDALKSNTSPNCFLLYSGEGLEPPLSFFCWLCPYNGDFFMSLDVTLAMLMSPVGTNAAITSVKPATGMTPQPFKVISSRYSTFRVFPSPGSLKSWWSGSPLTPKTHQ